MSLPLEPSVDEILKILQTQAQARHMGCAAYADLYANAADLAATGTALPAAEFDNLLEELAAEPAILPSLPADFARQGIYADHD